MFHYEYTGNLHIHSLHSDGSATVAEIAKLAAAAAVHFICLNDHAHMSGTLHLEEEGFYDKVLVLTGMEIGIKDHHYLAYDMKKEIENNSLGPQEVISQVNAQGGFGFLAHPFEKGMPFHDRSLAYPWMDLSVNGYTGICIWNFASRWKERVKTVLHGLFFLTFKRYTLQGPSKETLSFWDALCQQRRMVAIGGSDAHGGLFKWGPIKLKPLPYEELLRSINVHIFLNKWMPRELGEAKKDVYGALREGRLFIAYDGLCPAKGFRFDFISEDGSDLFMGEEAEFGPGEFYIELPHHGEIRLIKDGSPLRKWRGKEAVFKVTEKGVYRVEVYRSAFPFGWRPWIFSNPIYLR